MTISNTNTRVDYVGTGSVGPFAYTFKIYLASDLLVTKEANGIDTTLSYPADYSVTGAGDTAGGAVTLSIALAVNETLTIRRVRPLTQLVNLRSQGPFLPGNYEDALDQLTMLAQQIQEETDASVRLPESISPAAFDTSLPATLAGTPGAAVVVNAAGNGLSMAALSTAQLSAWNAATNISLDVFTSGFTPGVTTQLTLSAAPVNVDNLTVSMRISGTVRLFETDEYSISGTTLTFASPIPVGTTRIEVKYLLVYQVNTVVSQNIPWQQAGTGASTRVVRDKLREVAISPYDFGAVGDGWTDDLTAYTNAVVRAHAIGGTLTHPPGTFKLSDNVTVNSNVTLDFSGGGKIAPATGKTVTINGPIVGKGRRQLFAGLGSIVFGQGSVLYSLPEWFGAVHDGATNDLTAINKAATAAIGAAKLVFGAGNYFAAGDIVVDRTVNVSGAGMTMTTVSGSGGVRKFKITGSTGVIGNRIEGIGFDHMQVRYGDTNADQGARCTMVACSSTGADIAVYYGYNCYQTNLTDCYLHDFTTAGVYFDFATAAVNSGANMSIIGGAIYLGPNLIYVNGITADGFDIRITSVDMEHASNASIKTVAAGDGEIHVYNSKLGEINTHRLIDQDGATIWINGFFGYNPAAPILFETQSGRIMLSNGRMVWNANGFALYRGGTIYYDASTMISNSPLFGKDAIAQADPASTAGALLNGRNRWNTFANVSANMTNGSPNATTLTVAYAFDRNIRIWEFDFASTTAGASDNILQVLLNPGGTVFLNFPCPLFDGKGHVKLMWIPGVSFSGSGDYVITATGVATKFQLTTADGTAIGFDRPLDMKTAKAGATASAIAITNLYEDIMGAHLSGL